MITKSFYLLWFIITIQFAVNRSWLLAQSGLNESYRVLHLSNHYARVFLSIRVKSNRFPTLIETQWPETYFPPRPAILFPHRLMHANGDHTDCSLIQQARWSQLDSLSRLWVMDIGWPGQASNDDNKCPPKLMVFDLLKHNIQVLQIDCSQYMQPNDTRLLDIKLGPRISSCGIEKFIYFILANDSHLLAYDILEQKWHYPKLRSKKYKTINEFLPIHPQNIAFGLNTEILISDNDGNLYSSANNMNRFATKPYYNYSAAINMTMLGALLGPTHSMILDSQGALFYVVPKFGAVVRCIYGQNITTEDSEIIYMTSKNIQQIFFGSEDSVWLLSDKWLSPYDNCFAGF